MIRPCPHCWCEDSCGREALVSRPSSDERDPSPTDVYNAYFEFYCHDRTVPDMDSWYLARDLVQLGYLNSMPTLVDFEHAQELIREVER
jgi:hypothetical protein